MIQIRLQNTQIFRLVLAFCIIVTLFFTPSFIAEAAEFGEIHYNNTFLDYSKIDKDKTLYLADLYFNKALNNKDNEEKLEYLQKASGMYFLLSQIDTSDLYPIVQMARVYDYENQNSYAKAYFYKALKMERYNAATNYYFGEYYYAREDYRRALYFYNTAFENGYRENYDVLLKMAIMYEKLGDLLRANQYYKKAFLVKPSDKELPNKIRELEAIKYRNTGYYDNLKRK
jgi:tetratricopeptide (TPR) repeat protein